MEHSQAGDKRLRPASLSGVFLARRQNECVLRKATRIKLAAAMCINVEQLASREETNLDYKLRPA